MYTNWNIPILLTDLRINELMFINTPAQMLHWLLGVRQKVFMPKFKNNNNI